MAQDQGARGLRGMFGKASEGWTVRTIKNLDLVLYFSYQMGPINGFQEDCDTITSILWKEWCHDWTIKRRDSSQGDQLKERDDEALN